MKLSFVTFCKAVLSFSDRNRGFCQKQFGFTKQMFKLDFDLNFQFKQKYFFYFVFKTTNYKDIIKHSDSLYFPYFPRACECCKLV